MSATHKGLSYDERQVNLAKQNRFHQKKAPSKRVQAKMDEVASRVSQGDTVDLACSFVGWTYKTYLNYRQTYPSFAAQMNRARAVKKGEFEAPVLPFDAEFRQRFFGHETPPHMQRIIEVINEQVEIAESENRRDRRVLILLPPEHAKALALDTPIPTPDGWTTMGAVRVGDRVFDERGEPCTVTHVSEVFHKPCSEVTFSDGSTIVASDDHLWLTRTRKPQYGLSVKTTREIAETVYAHGRPNHGVPVQQGLRTPDIDLLIDPYVLGAWLGDGHSAGGRITTADPEIVQEIEQAGYEVTRGSNAITFGILDLQRQLRKLNLLNNKHIPATYLRAGEKQRMALLQGLMDTDGTCSKKAQCMFSTTNPVLAFEVQELILSLGFKCRRYESRAMLNGKDCGPVWNLSFYPRSDRPVFRLRRKWERQLSSETKNDRDRWQTIVAVEPTETVMTRCISVDSPSNLFLAGETFIPTHNTTLIQQYLVYRLAMDPTFRASMICSTLNQAKKRIGAISRMLTDRGEYQDLIDTYGPFKSESRADIKPWTSEHVTHVRAPAAQNDYSLQACGWTGSIYGDRMDIIVYDDIATLKNQTPAQIEAQWEKTWGENRSRIRKGGLFVVIGTHMREGDIYTRMQDKGFFSDVVVMPAIVREPGTKGDDDPGEALWEEGTSLDELLKLREDDVRMFELMYQQNPLPSVGAVFPHDAIESCFDDMRTIGDVPEGSIVVAGVDPSVNNYTAGVVIALKRHESGEWMRYLVDVWNEKNLTGEGGDNHLGVVEFIVELCRAYRVNTLCVEDGAWMSLINNAFTLRSKLYDLGVTHVPIKATEQTVGAEAIRQLSGLFTHRLISLPGTPQSKHHLSQFTTQLLTWTGERSHWRTQFDIVKAFRQAEHAVKRVTRRIPSSNVIEVDFMPARVRSAR